MIELLALAGNNFGAHACLNFFIYSYKFLFRKMERPFQIFLQLKELI